ncbi:MAG: hypothetical protein MUC54_06975 [Chloroflexi bacterium]|jgi:hypothetical protein|nr:hypothetical protein [Chloroflexota bacterium]
MKRRILIALTSVGLLVGAAAAPAAAVPYGPDRYQVTTTTYDIAVLDTYHHLYTVTLNPCDGSIAITGATAPGVYYTTETVTGTLAGGVISFSSTYDGPYNPGYTWSGSFPVGGGALSGQYTGTVTMTGTTSTAHRNHGEYVAATGGGADAAHACIGMPIVPPGGAAEGTGPDTARLVAHLEAVIAKLQANAKANERAVAAIQRHVDALGAGGVPAATKPAKPDKPAKPELPEQAKGNPNPGNPGRP